MLGEEEFGKLSGLVARIFKVHDPMGSKEVVIIQEATLFPPKKLEYSLPRFIDIATKGLSIFLLDVLGYQRRKVNQPVLQQFQLGKRFTAIVHCLEHYK